jgi:hypothetical protein
MMLSLSPPGKRATEAISQVFENKEIALLVRVTRHDETGIAIQPLGEENEQGAGTKLAIG